ncbi:thioredoxin family protein [Streptomyces sp. ISL-86]|nr:thioredoxin family protein [Streptomyces sp. ISL-86]
MRCAPGALGSAYECAGGRAGVPRRSGTRTGAGVRGQDTGHDTGRGAGRHTGGGRGAGAFLGAVELGAEPGARATLVQFSSAFCQPCRATRRILAEVAAMVDGVAHIEIDAERNLALVRALGVEKTPTVLVLDAAGGIVRRAVGMPRKADVIAALGVAVAGV